ncbi:MAG: alpha-mannosidase [Anaerolineae bacterium]
MGKHKIRFTVEKLDRILQDIQARIYVERIPVETWISPDDLPDGTTGDLSGWRPIRSGELWGGWDQWRWFRATLRIPEAWAGRRVAAFIALSHPMAPIHSEALAFLNGVAVQGIDRNHKELLLAESAQGGEQFDLALHAWCTMHAWNPAWPFEQIFQGIELVSIDAATRRLYHTAEAALDVARNLDEDDVARYAILNALDDALMLLDFRVSGDFYGSVPVALAALEGELARHAPMPVKIVATGHAHIDVAWLWTLARVREKAAHTFASMLRLMEQYPEFHFTQSQPQLYQYVKEDYPHLYEQIKQRVQEGRWEIIGGMWVEADCNISGGESLARQFLLGRRFFMKEFGREDSPVLWLPDVFGYAWALPQLIKRAGLEYFMTIKIGWSQYNRLPYDSFWWQGLDGTRVLTHFITTPDYGAYASTYNAMMTGKQALGTWRNYQQKEHHDELLTAFGYGDGGGGPTLEMLERSRALKRMPGAPQVRHGSVASFFENLKRNARDLPTWNGELYLEYHRGTLTSQARNKRYNRKSEVLMHQAELAAAMAQVWTGAPYPAEAFHEAWTIICRNQFHDIIPGSSIHEVYEDSYREYERVMALGSEARQQALQQLAAATALPAGTDGVLIYNALGWERRETIDLPAELVPEGKALADAETETLVPMQRADGKVIVQVTAPASGYQVYKLVDAPASEQAVDAGSPFVLENTHLRAEFNDRGELIRLYDKDARRDVLPAGMPGNQFQAFQDKPMRWPAWDVDVYFEDKMWTVEQPGEVEKVEAGPLRQTLRFRLKLLNSAIEQRVSLAADSRRLDFHTEVDWHEKDVLLKVAFPVDVLSPRATFDIQFGNVERPTHRNTSWDWARFETAVHKWADLSEGDYGVSLLNDCKYGNDVHDNVLRLSLLRSPNFPDPHADEGHHEFTYSLYPHPGDWRHGTVREGYQLNDPLVAVPFTGRGGTLPLRNSFLWVDAQNVIVETVKRAEDGDGLIVRLYECYRQRGPVTLHCSRPIAAAWETDLIERNETALDIVGGDKVELFIRPYEVRTLRLRIQ